MKTVEEIMAILVHEIEIAEARWDYVWDNEGMYDNPDDCRREKDRALDEMTALKVLYRRITGERYVKPA